MHRHHVFAGHVDQLGSGHAGVAQESVSVPHGPGLSAAQHLEVPPFTVVLCNKNRPA